MLHAQVACVITSPGCDVAHIARCVWHGALVVLGVAWDIFTPGMCRVAHCVKMWRAAHWFLVVGLGAPVRKM